MAEERVSGESVALRVCSNCGEKYVLDKSKDRKAMSEAELKRLDNFFDLGPDQEKLSNASSLRSYITSGDWAEKYNDKLEYEKRLRQAVDTLPPGDVGMLCHACLPNLERSVDMDSLLLQHEVDIYLKTSKAAKEEENQLAQQLDELLKLDPTVDEELLALQKELDKEIDAQKEIAAERAELETSLKALDERDKLLQKLNQVRGSVEATKTDALTEYAATMRTLGTYKTLTNVRVYDDAFHIDVLSPVPTINGFSLGVEPGKQPEWKSINEGWGQCAFVLGQLVQMAKAWIEDPTTRSQFNKIRKYRLWPRGARPYVEEVNTNNTGKKHPLFADKDPNASAGSFMFGWVWNKEKSGFDKAMEGYLSLLGVLCEFLKHLGMNSVPYVFVVQHDAISGDSIYDPKRPAEKFSILLTDNTHDKWTMALRYMLANLQTLIQWYEKRTKSQLNWVLWCSEADCPVGDFKTESGDEVLPAYYWDCCGSTETEPERHFLRKPS